MIFATDKELMELESVEVVYNNGSKKIFEPYQYVYFRGGIIRNLYDKGLCKIIFHEKVRMVGGNIPNRKVRKGKRKKPEADTPKLENSTQNPDEVLQQKGTFAGKNTGVSRNKNKG